MKRNYIYQPYRYDYSSESLSYITIINTNDIPRETIAFFNANVLMY